MTHEEKLKAIKEEVSKLEKSINEIEKAEKETGHHFSIDYGKFIDKLNEIVSK